MTMAHSHSQETRIVKNMFVFVLAVIIAKLPNFHFPGPHTHVHLKLDDRDHQPDNLCRLQSSLPRISCQEIQVSCVIIHSVSTDGFHKK